MTASYHIGALRTAVEGTRRIVGDRAGAVADARAVRLAQPTASPAAVRRDRLRRVRRITALPIAARSLVWNRISGTVAGQGEAWKVYLAGVILH